MEVQTDGAAYTDRLVLDFLRMHSPTTIDTLARALVAVSWAQVFSAVDRLSRANQVRLRQTRERDYLIHLPSLVILGQRVGEPMRASNNVSAQGSLR